jgi:membrane protease subunit HflC
MSRLVSILVALFVAVMLLSSTLFVVDQRSFAIVYTFGQMSEVISEPGLHFKLPPPLQNVVTLDKRVMTLDTPDAERYLTSEQKSILVDAFVKWRIVEPRQYLQGLGGDDARARERMGQIVKAALTDQIVRHTVHDVLAGAAGPVMAAVRDQVANQTKQMGVQIIDVRIKRVDYIDQVSSAVFDRMKAERERVANALRSTGSADAEKIRADADRQRTVIMAEAYRDAEKIKGEGDAKASQIYSQAFGKNPEFYKFYRSLEAYRASFRTHNDVLVVDPNSEFFKYFKNPGK